MDDGHEIGQRLREVRSWRQLSIRAVAELSGLSWGYLAKIERGEKPVTKRSVLDALARSLRVSPTELTGQPYPPSDPMSSDAHAAVADVESALAEYELGTDPEVAPRPWAEVVATLRHLNEVVRARADYAEQGVIVPGLLADLHATYVRSPQRRREALVGLVHAYHAAAVLTKNQGVRGLPLLAARLAQTVAEELGDPAWLGVAAWMRGHVSGHLTRRFEYQLSVRAADALRSHLADSNAAQVYGMLQLNAALACAAQRRAEETHVHLAEAAEIAARLPEHRENFGYLYFGPDNVGVWRVSLATELGEGPRVAELARGVRPEAIPAAARQAMFYADLGRALAAERTTRDEGIRALVKAESIAPQRVRHSVFVRETVANLLTAARRDATGREVRGLAWRMGVAPTG
jgi:transcriptional regulator with XRE-family HTH domain